MEQLNVLISFKARVKDKTGNIHPFFFTISEPVAEDEYSAYCVISCPYLRDKDFKIIGVDEEQATELSIRFITNMLEGQVLLDDNGNKISPPKPYNSSKIVSKISVKALKTAENVP